VADHKCYCFCRHLVTKETRWTKPSASMPPESHNTLTTAHTLTEESREKHSQNQEPHHAASDNHARSKGARDAGGERSKYTDNEMYATGERRGDVGRTRSYLHQQDKHAWAEEPRDRLAGSRHIQDDWQERLLQGNEATKHMDTSNNHKSAMANERNTEPERPRPSLSKKLAVTTQGDRTAMSPVCTKVATRNKFTPFVWAQQCCSAGDIVEDTPRLMQRTFCEDEHSAKARLLRSRGVEYQICEEDVTLMSLKEVCGLLNMHGVHMLCMYVYARLLR
jgi:hypothetical protein